MSVALHEMPAPQADEIDVAALAADLHRLTHRVEALEAENAEAYAVIRRLEQRGR